MRWSRTAVSSSVGVAAFALIASLAMTSAGAVADPAGTIETTPTNSVLRQGFSILGGDASAWVEYGGASPTLPYQFISTTTQSPITVDNPELVSPDISQTLVAGDHLLLIDFNATQLAAVRLSDGHVTVNDLAGFAAFSNVQLWGGTSTGWVVTADDVNGTHYFVQPYAGGAATEITQPGDGIGSIAATCSAGIVVRTTATVDVGGTPTTVNQLTLISSDGTSNRVVVANAGDTPTRNAGCSSTTVAWVDGTTGDLAHQPVGGGAIVTAAAPTSDPWSVVSVAGGSIGFVNDLTFQFAVWLDAGDPQLITLPAGYFTDVLVPSKLTDGTPALLAPAYDNNGQGRLLWFTGGTNAVQSLEGPFQTLAVAGLAASAGKAYDQVLSDPGVAQTDYRTSPLFVRSVGGSPLAFGSASSFLPRASAFLGSSINRGSRFVQGFGVSGARAAVPTWPTPGTLTQELTLLDNGVRKAGIALPTRAQVVSQSGPYTAVVPGDSAASSFVTLPDGHVVASLPKQIGQVVMDGSRAVYSATDGSVWVRDVAKPTSSSNPKKVLPACGSATVECGRRLAVWGSTIAAGTIRNGVPYGSLVTVSVAGGTVRTLKGLTGALAVSLRGKVLMYVTESATVRAIRVADLSLSTPTSVLVANDSSAPITRATLDGHAILWQTGDTTKAAPVPAGVDTASSPRLLGTYGASTIGRNGGALTQAWKPQFDLDAQVDSWTVTVKKGSAVVKTFTGSGPTAAIRSISWDGKSQTGTIVAPGTYTWTLTGSNADGSIKNVVGTGAATGTITVVTTVKSSQSIAASPKVVVYGSSTSISGKLVKAGTTTGLAGEPVQLWTKKAGTSTWALVTTGWTNATGGVAFSVRPTATAAYQLKHPTSPQSFADSSTAVTVTSTFKLTASWSASTVKRGGSVKVAGSLAPGATGTKVSVQKLAGGVWKTIATLTVTSGKFSGTVAVGGTPGTVSFRVFKAADSTHALAATAVKKITVT